MSEFDINNVPVEYIPSGQTIKYKFEVTLFYVLILVISMGINDFIGRLLDLYKNPRLAVWYNGFYIIAMMVVAALFVWMNDVKVNF